MVNRAMVSAMSPTASSRLWSRRWSWAPRRHSQPEMAASGVMNRKHTMSQHSVRFSVRGPGSFSHCGGGGGAAEVGFVPPSHESQPEPEPPGLAPLSADSHLDWQAPRDQRLPLSSPSLTYLLSLR